MSFFFLNALEYSEGEVRQKQMLFFFFWLCSVEVSSEIQNFRLARDKDEDEDQPSTTNYANESGDILSVKLFV